MINESKILPMLETLTGDVGNLKQGQEQLEQQIDGLTQDVSGLKQGQKQLEQQIDGLTQDVSGLKQGQETLEYQIDGLTQDASNIKQDVSSLKHGFSDMQGVQKAILEEINHIHESLVRIENDQGYKINVLFDAFQASKDENADTRQRVSILEKRVDQHDFEILALKTEA